MGSNPFDITPSDRTPTGNATGGLNSVPGKNVSNQSGGLNLDDYSNWNGDWYGYMKYKAEKGDAEWMERYWNYMMGEQSAATAREWTANREDTAYQRMAADMRAAGINPYALMQSTAGPISSSSSGNSYNSSNLSTAELKRETNSTKWISVLTSIISAVALIAVAMI